MKTIRVIFLALVLAFLIGLTSCSPQLGGGGSVVSGGTGPGGTTASSQLRRCSSKKGTVALNFDQSEYRGWYYRYKLPSSPIPLVRLMLQQSGCFTVVDRSQGLRAAKEELAMADQGLLRKGSRIHKGQMVAADYTLTPHIIFSENDAGGIGAGLGHAFGSLGSWAGSIVGGAKFKEAQTSLELIDNRSGVQIAAAEGSARQTDLGGAVGFFRNIGAGAGGWQNTNEGKLIAAALMDAMNKIIDSL